MFNIQYIRFYLVAILIWPYVFTNAYYYCNKQKKLCGTNKHFMCDLDSVPIKADVLGLLPLTGSMKRLYVDRHNEHRNRLAGGEQEFGNQGAGIFPKATRMREVIWDDELAYIAGIHAKRCNMEHDACHGTERFPGSGQNLYTAKNSSKPKIGANFVLGAIDTWWNEYKDVDDGNALADEFPKGTTDWVKVGHFTAIANERTAFVGCGLALCQNSTSKVYHIHVTCNYSNTNVLDTFMYKKGNYSTSNCDYYESAPSSKYAHLCTNTGKIFKDDK
ncbi:venom allergen 3-like [Zeugodacus cucurbitae]|uniref:venom allergen 3-like n=1 Tax=Zeugodacus cucurbitae TaxID=28588 RepID=UPI0023D95641|nr:venom allergen 3-like [Zeugodacus cucurbitae]XP_054083605.1 venom allergen 3-like [Zeugodacus cucurbitae]